MNAAKSDGGTPLFVAAQQGDLATVTALARLGANVSTPTRIGATAMYVAAFKGHATTIAALAQLGAAVDPHGAAGSRWPSPCSVKILHPMDPAKSLRCPQVLCRAGDYLGHRNLMEVDALEGFILANRGIMVSCARRRDALWRPCASTPRTPRHDAPLRLA